MDEFVARLHQELRALEAELAADPRYLKLAKIRELLVIYELPASAPTEPTAAESAVETPTKLDRIRSETRAFIERSGGTAHRQDILDHLIRLGIMGNERQPMASFAAYLTEMKADFVSVGAGKWTKSPHGTPYQKRVKITHKHIPGSMTATIVEATARYLRHKGARAQSPEILTALRAQGIEAKLDITSCLSHSHLFDNIKGQGYGLVEWSTEHDQESETPNSGELSGAPKANGAVPLSP